MSFTNLSKSDALLLCVHIYTNLVNVSRLSEEASWNDCYSTPDDLIISSPYLTLNAKWLIKRTTVPLEVFTL